MSSDLLIVCAGESCAKVLKRFVSEGTQFAWPGSHLRGSRFWKIIVMDGKHLSSTHKQWYQEQVRTTLRPGGKLIWA